VQGRKSLARIQQWDYQQSLDGVRSALVGLESRGSRANPKSRVTTTKPGP
jgi:hypothetical protein